MSDYGLFFVCRFRGFRLGLRLAEMVLLTTLVSGFTRSRQQCPRPARTSGVILGDWGKRC